MVLNERRPVSARQGQIVLESMYHVSDENLQEELEALSDVVLEAVDKALLEQLKRSPQPIEELYHFFNTSEKPMKPREFLYFWRSLTEEERDSLMLRGHL